MEFGVMRDNNMDMWALCGYAVFFFLTAQIILWTSRKSLWELLFVSGTIAIISIIITANTFAPAYGLCFTVATGLTWHLTRRLLA
jgi:hypothetical protein